MKIYRGTKNPSYPQYFFQENEIYFTVALKDFSEIKERFYSWNIANVFLNSTTRELKSIVLSSYFVRYCFTKDSKTYVNNISITGNKI